MTAQATHESDVLPRLSLVTDVHVRNWASEIVLVCLDDPVSRSAYELAFMDCREISWLSDEAESIRAAAVEADVIGFAPGGESTSSRRF